MSTYEISKSSLLSLKAEILRKQEELVKAKTENNVKLKVIKKKTPLEIKNKGVEERQKLDLTTEEEDLLKVSRSVLEKKSKLYEELSKGKNNLSVEEKERNRRYLVRFDKKKSKVPDLPPEEDEPDVDKYPESEEERYLSDEYDDGVDDLEKWVEYTDCLGRSRKCLKKDLEYIKAKDAEFKDTIQVRNNDNDSPPSPKEPGSPDPKENENEPDKEVTEESELLSGDMRREMLRKQWEKEEEDLRDKTDIHYQNILFNEARAHGVGYYAFSKDEEERHKQQEELKKLREETEQQQRRATELKNLRDKQLAARMKAARNRKRARMGLPPEEDEPEVSKEDDKAQAEELKKQEEEKRNEEKEKQLENARKRHLRPWDVGKEGTKEFYQYSQEEWVEKKREDRPSEFAPPSAYKEKHERKFRSTKIIEENFQQEKNSLYFSSKGKAETKRKSGINPYKTYETMRKQASSDSELEEISSNDRLLGDYNQTMQDTEKDRLIQIRQTEPNSYKQIAQSSPMEPVPITNEVSSYSKPPLEHPSNTDQRGKGTEIAPPPTYDYYGPSSSKKARPVAPQNKVAESIEAGLRFLREQAEQKKKSTRSPW